MEILEGQELKLENLMSFRGVVNQVDIEKIGKEMEASINIAGAKSVGYPITAIYGVEEYKVDIEIILPIDKKIESIDRFTFKQMVKVVNAVVVKHKGSPTELHNTCNMLNQFIVEKNLLPITVGYNVTKRIDLIDIQNSEIEVYVGINPNIL